jgi:hypothetical protein
MNPVLRGGRGACNRHRLTAGRQQASLTHRAAFSKFAGRAFETVDGHERKH